MIPENPALSAHSPALPPVRLGVLAPNTINGPVGGYLKRAMDILLALTALLILLPVMVMVILLLKATAQGTPIFSHERVGYRGRSFKCLKFRTMVVNGDQVLTEHFLKYPAARVEWEVERKLRDDPRITTVGRILRLSSIDELPQIFNVLTGSMSIVGPRPIVSAEIERYGDAFAFYQSCRPGITGLWQVNGRSNCGYEQRVAFDGMYARQWSMLRDCWIIWKTVGVVVNREGSC